MKTAKEQLSSILKTTQMGQVGIRCVLDYATDANLIKELSSQLQEYDLLEQNAHKLAQAKGWELPELPAMARIMSNTYARANLMLGNRDSRIAAMMINGNTKGMIKSIKNMHHGTDNDPEVTDLTQKLLSYETANIRQMQGFL